jgi:hypothetical protein
MILLTILLCLIVTNIKADLSESLSDAASVIGSPEIKSAIEVLKAFKQESSTSISERYEPAGFESLNNVMSHGKGAVLSSNLDKLINLWLEDESFKTFDSAYKKVISLAMREFAIQVAEEPYINQKFDLSYNNGQGTLFLMSITLTPHKQRSDVFLWEKYLLMSTFRPSKPYVIITETDCNIINCDRTDHIVYLEASITDAHIRSLIDLNVQFLENFNSKYLTIG